MKKIILLAIAAVLLGAGFYFLNLPETAVNPKIEILSGLANVLNAQDKSVVRGLSDGDEINPGFLIKVSSGGSANLVFPDGSIARLDSETELLVEEAQFIRGSGKFLARFELLSGRVWSKVSALATPDSQWEVKTANAVATVRGTAFGVEYLNEKSNVVVAENAVAVAAIDPETKSVIENSEVAVSENQFVEVKKDDIQRMKSADRTVAAPAMTVMAVREAPKAMMESAWVARNIEADRRVIAPEGIRKEKENTSIDKDPQTFPVKAGTRAVEETRTAMEAVSKPAAVESKTGSVEFAPSVAIKPAVKPERLEVVAKSGLSAVKEGDQIFFDAVLAMSDGSKKIVTESAKLQALGNIGRLEKPGLFIAQLGAAVAEFGSAPGSVTAVWQDPVSGETFLANSPIFTVEANVEVILDSSRG